MVVELFVATIALYLWLEAQPGLARALLYNVMLIAGISTVLLLGALYLCGGEEAKPLSRPWLPLAVTVVIVGTLVYGTLRLPAFSDPHAPIHTHVVPRYLEQGPKETGVPNVVTAVLASYRGYDTLGETTVVFTAGAGVIALLRRRKRRKDGEGQ